MSRQIFDPAYRGRFRVADELTPAEADFFNSWASICEKADRFTREAVEQGIIIPVDTAK